MIQGVEGDPDQLAGFLPRYVDMRCDDDGAVWMQPVDLDLWDMAGSSTWLRISPDGVTQEVELPARFDPYRFTGGRIWGVQRDDFDVASVAWIALPSAR
jgi:hypothetical protein